MNLAIINVSTAASHPSRRLFAALGAEGHTVIPVRPGVDIIEGHQTYPTIAEVPRVLDGAILMVAPYLVDRYLDDCASAGVHRVWVDGDAAAISRETRARLAARGLVEIEPLARAPFAPRRSARETLRRIFSLRVA